MDKRYLFTLMLTPVLLLAKPSGPKVIEGKAAFTHPTKHHMEIITGDKTIINWETFSIKEGEVTQFTQPNGSSSVLNRVTSEEASHLMGALRSNGTVYLINPNGILIGPNAVIDTKAFIASSLDVLNKSFMKGKELRFQGDSKNTVFNLGTIHARDGDVILMGRFVGNQGTIHAPKGTATLAAGKEILLKPEGENRVFICPTGESHKRQGIGISSEGEIEALKVHLLADGNPYKFAIKHEGKIDALNVETRGGEIYLVAEGGAIHVDGALATQKGEAYILGKEITLGEKTLVDVSGDSGGGTVLVGGSKRGENRNLIHSESTIVQPGATMRANGGLNGDGGEVIVWSDGFTYFAGNIQARGGKNGGNGGFVEISGAHLEKEMGLIDRSAPFGIPGTISYDPSDILITTRPNVGLQFIEGKYIPTSETSILSMAALVRELEEGPVEIATHSIFDGSGDITIQSDSNHPLRYTSKYPLTLTAENDLIIETDIQNDSSGNIVCHVGRDLRIDGEKGVSRLGSRFGKVEIQTGQDLLVIGGEKGQGHLGSDGYVVKSDISLTVGRDLIVNAKDHFALIGHTNTETSESNDRSLEGNITIHRVGRDVSITSSTKDFAFAQIGLAAEKDNYHNSANLSCQGDVILSNVEGNISITAHSGKDAYALIGHGGQARRFIDSYSGNIIVNTKGTLNCSEVGASERTFAGIGFGQDFTVARHHSFNSDLISVTAGKDIILNGGQGKSANFIGAFTGYHETGETETNIRTIRVVAGNNLKISGDSSYAFIRNGEGPGKGHIGITVHRGDLLVTGSTSERKEASIDSYGSLSIDVHQGSLIATSQNDVSIQALGEMSIFTQKDLILNGGSLNYPANLYATGPTLIRTHGNLELAGNSMVTSFEKGVTLLIGGHLKMTRGSAIKNHSKEPLIISVNHGSKEDPRVAPKGFYMAQGSKINSSGSILLYTPSQALTQIEGMINDLAFVPGPLFINNANETWGPFPFDPADHPDVPFHIFYWDGASSFITIERSQLLVSELLTDLHPMNEYLGWSEEFQMAFNEEAYEKKRETGLSSFQVIGDQLYFQRMMNTSFHNLRMNGLITFPKPIGKTNL